MLKGKLIISFSNRAFWTKATRKWIESSDLQRLNYISEVLLCNSWSNVETIKEALPSNTIASLLGMGKDPFFAVIASK